MGLETYKAVTFKDRLMQAVEQIRAVDKKMEERIPPSLTPEQPEDEEDKFLRQCQKELRDSQDTLLTLHKEILFYISQ